MTDPANTPTANFNVVLKSALGSREIGYLGAFGDRLKTSNGDPLCILRCKDIDTTDLNYLEADVVVSSGVVHVVRIPHEYVMLIAKSDETLKVLASKN